MDKSIDYFECLFERKCQEAANLVIMPSLSM